MIGTEAGYKGSAGSKQLQGPKVEFLVAPEGGIQIALRLGECGRVQDNRVVSTIRRRIVPEQVEGIGFDPFDLAAVQGGVLISDFEGGARTVYARDVGATRGEMKGETPLIAEDVEGVASGVLGRRGVVLTLIEEGTGLLTFPSVVAELDVVHGEGCGGFLAL